MTGRLLVSLLYCFLPLLSCLQWENPISGSQTIRVCLDSDAHFPWDFVLHNGDVVTSIEWLHKGQSEQMVAFYSHGSFVPLPAYSGRLQHGLNGGLTLHRVTQQDTGNYFIDINGHDGSGRSFSAVRSVYLNVSDSLLTPNTPLSVTQSSAAVKDDVTNGWILQLSCGNFHDTVQPDFTVEWQTPSGQVLNSSSYKDGHFNLLLPNPVETGQYRCRIPDHFAGTGCLPSDVSVVGQATINLDDVQVRLKLLESEQNSLRQHNVLMQQENQELRQRLSLLENCSSSKNDSDLNSSHQAVQNLTDLVKNQSYKVENLTRVVEKQANGMDNLTLVTDTIWQDLQFDKQELTALKSDVGKLNNSSERTNKSVSSLSKELHILEAIHLQDKSQLDAQISDIHLQLSGTQSAKENPQTAPGTVSFHAQLDTNVGLYSGYTLVLTHVYNNDGHGYDNTTGVFTAPLNGTYFFIASTGSHNKTHDAYLEIVVEGKQLATAYAHRNNVEGEMATCHGVTDLKKGQRVWLKSLLSSFFNYADTFFSGFKI